MTPMQPEFIRALLDPALPAPAGLAGSNGPAPDRRFAVYRNNVTSSLIDALASAFPVIFRLVGEDFFRAMAGVFVRAHPPRSPLLMLYGADFADFLSAFPPVAHLPYLPDVARLEQARREAYHAADTSPLPPEALAAIPPDRLAGLRFGFAPAVRLIRSQWPVHGIWLANSQPDGPRPGSGPQDALVSRPHFDPVVTLLPPGGGSFAAALLDRATLAEATELAARTAGFELSAAIGALLAAAAVMSIEENPE